MRDIIKINVRHMMTSRGESSGRYDTTCMLMWVGNGEMLGCLAGWNK